MDLADGSLCLPDEVRIQLAGRRQLSSANSRRLELGLDIEVAVGGSVEIPIYSRASDRQKLWIIRGERWVPTYVKGLGRRRYLRITNLSDKPLMLFDDTWLGIWLNGDHVPRQPGFISVGSRRYNERQNLAYEASTDKPEKEEHVDLPTRPMVERPTYDPPTKIMARRTEQPEVAAARVKTPKEEPMQPWPVVEDRLANEMDVPRMMARGPEHSRSGLNVAQATSNEMPAKADGSPKLGIPETRAQEADQVCYHEGGDPLAEDFEDHMAVVPEVIATTEEVTLDDIQVGDPDVNSPEEIERLHHIIWKKAHLLIGKGNALPPAALGAICDIDVGDATPIAQRYLPREAIRSYQRIAISDDQFRATAGTPYFEDSHMLSPKKSRTRLGRNKWESEEDNSAEAEDDSDDDHGYRPSRDETVKDQIYHLSNDRGEQGESQYLELRSHESLDKIAQFDGRRYRSDDSLQWLKRFFYEMKGTRMPQAPSCEPFSLSLGRTAKSWYRQLPRKT
ncbi:Hypothetical protein PHPALM_714 [Phytophthora palmivora]|uniref:Aspartic protease n=1 Tax=Phytophthora palmivora TaxID=4796 RepID=A0A2P4YU61_9STRA|nr:Hypothetical protein PHPALM_714 [Phytophthora palmivora]